MRSIIVTGINGFVGKHLAINLAKHRIRVIGVGREKYLDKNVREVVTEYFECDLTDKDAVANIPLDHVISIINLAGIAQVGDSFNNPKLYNDVNIKVQTNIAERLLKDERKNIRIIAISTGAVYASKQKMPLDELSRLDLNGSPYALSKIEMEKALQDYIESGVDIVIARPFNHIGPGQLPGFLVPDLAAQIQNSNVIKVGNLDTERDYTDVRDVVRAYRMLATKPKLNHRLYNICSGKSVKGGEILNLIKSGMGKEDLKVILDPNKIRPNDPLIIRGDYKRLHMDTGWTPSYDLGTTVSDFVRQFKNSGAK